MDSKTKEKQAVLKALHALAEQAEDAARLKNEREGIKYDEIMRQFDNEWCDQFASEVFTEVINKAAGKYSLGPIGASSIFLVNMLMNMAKVVDGRGFGLLLAKLVFEDGPVNTVYESAGMPGPREYVEVDGNTDFDDESHETIRKTLPTENDEYDGVRFAMIYIPDLSTAKLKGLKEELLKLRKHKVTVLIFAGDGQRLTSGPLVEEGLVDVRLSFSVSDESEFIEIQNDPITFMKKHIAQLPFDLACAVTDDSIPTPKSIN